MTLSNFSLWVFVLIFATVNSVVNTTTYILVQNLTELVLRTKTLLVYSTEPATVRMIFFQRVYRDFIAKESHLKLRFTDENGKSYHK